MKQVIVTVVVVSLGWVICNPVSEDTGKQGWNSGSGWNNGWNGGGGGWNAGNNGSTAVAGETLVVTNDSVLAGSSDYVEGLFIAPDQDGNMTYGQDFYPYVEHEFYGDGSEAIDSNGDLAETYGGEAYQYSNGDLETNLTLTNFGTAYVVNKPYDVASFSNAAGVLGDFAVVSNGTNLNNNGWNSGSNSGWKKED